MQQLVTGFSIGGIYALLAVGYALIYSIFRFTNFAFGAIMMCSAYGSYFVVRELKITSIVIGLCGAVVVGVLLSMVTELVAYRSLRIRKASRLFLMISAMGVNIAIPNFMTIMMSANLRNLNFVLPFKVLTIGKIKIGSLDIFSLVISLIALGILWFFIEKTKHGIAIRASAHDTDTAGLMGINVNRISLIVFAISGFTAAIAGMFTGMKYAVYPTLGAISGKAFISSVIGGLGSLPGAVLGGFILGVLETMISGYISSAYRDLFSFGVLIVVLVFLPNGILGINTSDKL